MKNPRRKTPIAHTNSLSGKTAPCALENRTISHQGILERSTGYCAFMAAYGSEVLTKQTRTIRLLGRKNPSRIMTTLLGYEVQASYKRIQCPDLVTARYVKLFSELGFRSIHLPYDPTHVAKLIPEFEAAIDEINRRIKDLFPEDHRTRSYVTRRVYAIIRRQLPKKAVSREIPCEDSGKAQSA
ncbi:MAG TPA: hypothetical protein VLL97_03790 [Acidobacteriota bacterium]|nr:hypothetical protein [Acidobacteriota bacterium]